MLGYLLAISFVIFSIIYTITVAIIYWMTKLYINSIFYVIENYNKWKRYLAFLS